MFQMNSTKGAVQIIYVARRWYMPVWDGRHRVTAASDPPHTPPSPTTTTPAYAATCAPTRFMLHTVYLDWFEQDARVHHPSPPLPGPITLYHHSLLRLLPTPVLLLPLLHTLPRGRRTHQLRCSPVRPHLTPTGPFAYCCQFWHLPMHGNMAALLHFGVHLLPSRSLPKRRRARKKNERAWTTPHTFPTPATLNSA